MHLDELMKSLTKESKMADIFGTEPNKATQAVIDAASKILMGVNDDETAKAQTEEEHPAVVHAEAKKAKMDPVGKEDGDIDNDGDKDDSDEYLGKRRKAIKKAMAKEELELPDYVVEAIEDALVEDESYEVELEESEDLNTDNAAKVVNHDCAKHVVHKEHGEGQCVPGMHTLEENEDGTGYVTHYDVMFGDKVIEDVPVEELEIISEMNHGHPKKKKK